MAGSATKAAAAAAASVSEANAAAATSEEDIIQLEEGWKHCRDTGVQPFITRIETAFDANEFERCTIKAGTYMEVYEYEHALLLLLLLLCLPMSVCSKVFKMCIQRDPYNHSEALYVHYTSSIRSYLCDTVSTALSEARASNEISFLREWTKRWKYQQILVRGLAGMFTYLVRTQTSPSTSTSCHLMLTRRIASTCPTLRISALYPSKASTSSACSYTTSSMNSPRAPSSLPSGKKGS